MLCMNPLIALDGDERLALVGQSVGQRRGGLPGEGRRDAGRTREHLGRGGRDGDLAADARVVLQPVRLHQVLNRRRRRPPALLASRARARTSPRPEAHRRLDECPAQVGHRALRRPSLAPPRAPPYGAVSRRSRRPGAAPAVGVPQPVRHSSAQTRRTDAARSWQSSRSAAGCAWYTASRTSGCTNATGCSSLTISARASAASASAVRASVTPGQCRDRRQGRTVAEDGGSPRDDHDVGWQPAQLQQYPARHRPRPDRYDPVGVGGIRPDAVSRKSLEQLTEQERVPRGRPLAGGDEQGCGSYAEPSLHQFRRRLRGQRRRPYDERLGFERQLCDAGPRGRVARRCAGSPATSTGTASSRRARYARKRSEAPSHHCASSTASTSGPSVVRLTASQYKPCSTAKPSARPPSAMSNTAPAPGRRPTQQLARDARGRRLPPRTAGVRRRTRTHSPAAPAGRQHPHGPLGREPARLGQQPRLSDPGRTLEQAAGRAARPRGRPASTGVRRARGPGRRDRCGPGPLPAPSPARGLLRQEPARATARVPAPPVRAEPDRGRRRARRPGSRGHAAARPVRRPADGRGTTPSASSRHRSSRNGSSATIPSSSAATSAASPRSRRAASSRSRPTDRSSVRRAISAAAHGSSAYSASAGPRHSSSASCSSGRRLRSGTSSACCQQGLEPPGVDRVGGAAGRRTRDPRGRSTADRRASR